MKLLLICDSILSHSFIFCRFYFLSIYIYGSKGKAVPLQVWKNPEGSRNLRLPDFVTTAKDGGKFISLTHRPPLPLGNTPVTHLCLRLCRSQGHSAIGGVLYQRKTTLTPVGIKPATFRFVTVLPRSPHILLYSSLILQFMYFYCYVYVFLLYVYLHRANWHSSATLTECAFSSVVRQMPGYYSQIRGTARNLHTFLCCSTYRLCCVVLCTVCV